MLELLKRSRKKDTPPVSNIDSLIRDGDDLFSDTLILLNERLSGNLFCSESIVIEQNGVLSGNVTSKQCVVSGTITGDIVSTGQTEIKGTAIIKGNIISALINVEPGAVINGRIKTGGDMAAWVNELSKKIKKANTQKMVADKAAADTWPKNGHPVPAAEIQVTPKKLNADLKAATPSSNNNGQVVAHPAANNHAGNSQEAAQQSPVKKPALKAPEPPPANNNGADSENIQRWW
jgi:cytoskeletal protein CcmA (bactofilin family)